MNPHLVYDIEAAEDVRDVLIAFLGELEVDSMQETDKGLIIYPSPGAEQDRLEQAMVLLQRKYPFRFSRRSVSPENWNALWEANFQPIRIGNFCGVRANFHYPFLDVQHEIVITPRMTFGTGHHETTYMMLEAMEKLDFSGAKVLDYGCGTGILAILAARMGATMVDAVDIEEEAYQNTLYNLQINDIDSVQVIHGTLEAVLDRGYRIILANINRNVLLASLDTLYDKLARPGFLLLSGLLEADGEELMAAARKLGFRVGALRQKGEWVCIGLELANS